MDFVLERLRVYEYARGHLYETHVLCKMLYDNQFRGRVVDGVWETSLSQALGELGEKVFEGFYDKASETEQKIIHCLAGEDEPVNQKGFEEKVREAVGGTSGVRKHFRRLVEKGLIDNPKRGVYLISDGLFREYILQVSKIQV